MNEQKQQLNEGNKHLRTFFLEDSPAEDDAFGSHDRVAKAMANMIKNNKGGKAIGLRGSWGSGKSTIVKLLMNDLNKDEEGEKNCVFVFDAWYHQGDPLRKTFLKELIEFFKEGWVKEGFATEESEITDRKEETNTTTQPILSLTGIIVAVCILFLPLGYALIYSDENFLNFLPIPPWKRGLIIIILPLIVITLSCLSKLFKKWLFKLLKKSKDKDFNSKKEDSTLSEAVSGLIFRKTREDTKSTTFKSPSPTSFEFNKIFGEVMDKALSDKECKFVIVIDNLDRVSNNEALSIWGTMRTFFDQRSQSPAEWLDKFWLLVPFDDKAPQRLWNTDLQSSNAESSKNLDDDISDAFVEKTFQAIYHVPPPLLMDWKNFLINNLNEALPDYNENDFEEVYRLYRIKEGNSSQPPTPRDIKKFINRLCVYHQIWEDQIPLKYQALYALCGSDIKSPEKDIPDDSFITPDIRRFLGEDYKTMLAAIHLNIDKEKASQIMINDILKDSINNLDTEKIRSWSRVKGFAGICEEYICENIYYWETDEPGKVLSAVKILSDIDLSPSAIRIWNYFQCSLKNIMPNIKKLDESAGEGIIKIIEKSNNETELIKYILRYFSDYISTIDNNKQSNGEDQFAGDWLKCLLKLFNYLEGQKLSDLISDNFILDISGKSYLEIICALSQEQNAEKLVKYFKPKGEPKDIIAELSSVAKENKLTEEHNKAIKLMNWIDIKWPWHECIPAFINKLEFKEKDNLEANYIELYLVTILTFAYILQIEEAKTSIEKLVSNSHIMHQLHLAETEKHKRSSALCTLVILIFNPALQSIKSSENVQAGFNFYTNFKKNPDKFEKVKKLLSKFIKEYGILKELLNANQGVAETTNIIKKLLNEIISSEEVERFIDNDLIINQYQEIKNRLNKENIDKFDELINLYIDRCELLNDVLKYEFTPDKTPLYLKLLDSKTDVDKSQYVKYLSDGLKSIYKDKWREELNEEGQLLKIISEIKSLGHQLELNANFRDPLFDHSLKILQGQTYPKEYADKWNDFIEALEFNEKATFLRNIRDHFLRHYDSDLSNILQLYGDIYLNYQSLLFEKADDIVRQLFINIIDRKNMEELKWLKKFICHNPKLLDECDDSSRDSFSKGVNGLVEQDFEEEEKEKKQIVEEIKALINNNAN